MVVPLLLGPSDVSFKIEVPTRGGGAAARGDVVPKHVLSTAGTTAVPGGSGDAGAVSGIVWALVDIFFLTQQWAASSVGPPYCVMRIHPFQLSALPFQQRTLSRIQRLCPAPLSRQGTSARPRCLLRPSEFW